MVCFRLSNARSDFALHQQTHSDNMFPEAENDKSILHSPVHLHSFTLQQSFKPITSEPVNPFRRMMTEKLNHSSGRLQVFPHLVKSPQSNLGHFESYRQSYVRSLSEEPPAFSSAEQVKISKGFFMDSKALLKIQEKEAALILVCKSWP